MKTLKKQREKLTERGVSYFSKDTLNLLGDVFQKNSSLQAKICEYKEFPNIFGQPFHTEKIKEITGEGLLEKILELYSTIEPKKYHRDFFRGSDETWKRRLYGVRKNHKIDIQFSEENEGIQKGKITLGASLYSENPETYPTGSYLGGVYVNDQHKGMSSKKIYQVKFKNNKQK
jgi:hypothetical protein